LIDALALQTRFPDEMIVAEAGSKDGTAELVQARCVHVVHGGMPAVERNAGRAAKGDLLLFLDADVLPPPDFFVRVLEEFEQKKPGVTTCFIVPLDGNPFSMRRGGKEGLVKLSLKYAWCEIYALMGKPVHNAPFKYAFGFSPLNVSNRLDFCN
jgi:GT2 family glycosyltransferase